MAKEWGLKDTSFSHELLHIWLAATTGNADAEHTREVWKTLDCLLSANNLHRGACQTEDIAIQVVY